MARITHFLLPVALFSTTLAALASCSGDEKKEDPGAYDAGPPILSIEPAEAGIFVKGAQDYTVRVSLPNDVKKKPKNDAGEIPPRDPPVRLSGESLTWESSDPDVATINELGRAAALKAGDTVIKATTKSAIDGGGIMSITAALNVKNPGNYETLRVDPATATVVAGEYFQFKALGKPFGSTTETDVTTSATWSTSVLTVANIERGTGRARGLCAGRVQVIATVGVVDSAPAELTVTGCLPDAGPPDAGGDGGSDSGPSDAGADARDASGD